MIGRSFVEMLETDRPLHESILLLHSSSSSVFSSLPFFFSFIHLPSSSAQRTAFVWPCFFF